MKQELYDKISVILADNDDPEVCFEGETMPKNLDEYFKERAFDLLYDIYLDYQKEQEE